MELNEYADKSSSEFNKRNGYVNTNTTDIVGAAAPSTNAVSGTTASSSTGTVDWTTTPGIVGPVLNQGQCASCWAFSAAGSLEGQWALKHNNLYELSPQNLVDCANTTYGNYGCSGGAMSRAFDYINRNHGINTEQLYPYQGTDNNPCRYQYSYPASTLSSYVLIQAGSESALLTAVTNVGPVSASMDASLQSFQLYKSGVYKDMNCSSTVLNHGVLVVGYGTDSATGLAYWKVKNSWGSTWGESGYFRIARNANNLCGMATAAVYPVL